MIEVKNLKKNYGHVKAVDDITLTINKGEVLGFLGPNGAGKTTTMKVLTGFIAPTSGTVTVDGIDILDDSLAIRQKIGYLPENNPLYEDMKVYEYLLFIGGARGMEGDSLITRLKEMIDICGLQKVVKQPIAELSKGYRQRVGLAQALIGDPEILILDEPTSGLDPNQIVEIRELIKNIGKEKTIILCSHIMQEVEATCDRVVIISSGKIVAEGKIADLQQQAQGKQNLYLKVRGPQEEIKRELTNLAEVTNVRLVDDEAIDIKGYQMEVSQTSDLREIVFKKAISNNWTILELKQSGSSLEDVFRKLTSKS